MSGKAGKLPNLFAGWTHPSAHLPRNNGVKGHKNRSRGCKSRPFMVTRPLCPAFGGRRADGANEWSGRGHNVPGSARTPMTLIGPRIAYHVVVSRPAGYRMGDLPKKIR